MDTTERVRFAPVPPDGSVVHGRLRRAAAATEPSRAAVLCHPHPDAGGTMDVWLLPTIGAALAEAGWHVLRFDFRSVRTGAAPGRHERELADLAGAVAFLRAQGLWVPGHRLALAGWSFGALVALLYGLDDPCVTDWVGIAPPTRPLAELPMAPVPDARVAAWPARRTVIVGEHDQFFPAVSADAVSPHALHVVRDCDHFFFDRDQDLAALVASELR